MMPNLHSKQVKIWTDLQEQIMDAGLMTEAIDWEEGHSQGPGRITCSLTPKESGHNYFPFSGTKTEFDNLLRFIKFLRSQPSFEWSISPRPTDYRMERLVAITCPVCRCPASVGRAVHGTRGGKHGAIIRCGNPQCLSLYWTDEGAGGIQTILRASASSTLAASLYRVERDDPDKQGADLGDG